MELKFCLNIAVLTDIYPFVRPKACFFLLGNVFFFLYFSRRVVWWKRSASSKAEVSFTITPTGFFIGSGPAMGNRYLYTSGRVVSSCGCVRTLSKGIS